MHMTKMLGLGTGTGSQRSKSENRNDEAGKVHDFDEEGLRFDGEFEELKRAKMGEGTGWREVVEGTRHFQWRAREKRDAENARATNRKYKRRLCQNAHGQYYKTSDLKLWFLKVLVILRWSASFRILLAGPTRREGKKI